MWKRRILSYLWPWISNDSILCVMQCTQHIGFVWLTLTLHTVRLLFIGLENSIHKSTSAFQGSHSNTHVCTAEGFFGPGVYYSNHHERFDSFTIRSSTGMAHRLQVRTFKRSFVNKQAEVEKQTHDFGHNTLYTLVPVYACSSSLRKLP